MTLQIFLTDIQFSELESAVVRHPKSYMRERASAILKLHSGISGVDIASKGLLRKRRKNTVYDWINRYKSEGLTGLEIKTGRGRKPSFSPCTRIGSGT